MTRTEEVLLKGLIWSYRLIMQAKNKPTIVNKFEWKKDAEEWQNKYESFLISLGINSLDD